MTNNRFETKFALIYTAASTEVMLAHLTHYGIHDWEIASENRAQARSQ